MDTLGNEMIYNLGETEWDGLRFHRATQNRT
jgi:hypothetical protein